MSDRHTFRPFTKDAGGSFRLSDPPLAMVLCQIRWPEISTFRHPDAMAAAVKKLDSPLAPYPIIEQGQEATFILGANGMQPIAGAPVYRWTSVDGAWKVNLAQCALSLTCLDRYVNFNDFAARLAPLMAAVIRGLEIPVFDRVGIRYVNRFPVEADRDSLRRMLKRHHGYEQNLGSAIVTAQMEHVIYRADDVSLQVRSGDLPAGETFDPSVPPASDAAWLVDLDASREARMAPNAVELMRLCNRLSDTCFDYFKFLATGELIRRFGGTYE